MRLVYQNRQYYFKCKFEDRLHAKRAGFYFDPVSKLWATLDPKVAYNLSKYADDDCLARLELDLNLTKIVPKDEYDDNVNLKLFNYQKEAVLQILGRTSNLLCLPPGAGKTAISIEACRLSKAKRILIICPPHLAINWQREFSMWYDGHPQVTRADKTSTNFGMPEEFIFIVPDSLVHRSRIISQLNEREYDYVIVDECHRFKNPEALRTISVFGATGSLRRGRTAGRGVGITPSQELKMINMRGGLVKLGKNKIAISGTPIVNRPIELYSVVSNIAPVAVDFMSKHQYGVKYCAAFEDSYGWNYQGASNLEELNAKLKMHVMIRRAKDEILKDLPVKRREVIQIEPDSKERTLVTFENKIVKAHFGVKDILDIGDVEITEAMSDFEVLGQLVKYREQVGLAKVDHAVEMIESFLENSSEKIVIFAWHKSVIDSLFAKLGKYLPVKVVGGMSAEQKDLSVTLFQTDPERRLIIGNTQAMGTGLTLTAASHLIMLEPSWVPGENEQCEDRVHRIGQTNPVMIQYLFFRDSIDELIYKAIFSKQKTINRAIGSN